MAIVVIVGAGGVVFGYFASYKHGLGGAACTMDAKLCSDGSYVGRVAPDCKFAECPTGDKGQKTGQEGGIQGIVLLGPTCPVMKNPPEEACADRPYSTDLAVTTSDATKVVIEFRSDRMGMFRVHLPAGEYAVRSTGSSLPRCSTNGTIKVNTDAYTETTVHCDTGIR